MFFDFDALYNETQGDAFASGKKKFYDNKVKSITTATRDGKFDIMSTVQGDRLYSCKITFDEQGGLYDYECDCDKFNHRARVTGGVLEGECAGALSAFFAALREEKREKRNAD